MTPTKTAPAIHVHNLSVTLDGHRLIEDISFDVPLGQTTAIIGPNGAGKSILIKTLLGLVPKQTGLIEIFGVDHQQLRRVASRLSYIPQSLAFDRTLPLTVAGLFALKSRQRLGMAHDEYERMETLLKMVGMHNLHDARLGTLSGGQLQRVFIAYSLMNKPELLILDEPSAGIDVTGEESIYNLLERIQQLEHLTLLLVSHELDIVMRYAEQVLCLNKRLLCAGVPREVLSNEMLAQMYGSPVGHFEHKH